MTITPASRIFSYAGISLPDLDRHMPPEEIKAAYSMQYPESATAAIQGPEPIGDKLRYEFVRSVGAKG